MKKHYLTSILAVAVTFATVATLQSCSKVAKELKFNLPMQTQSVTINVPATSAGTVTFPAASNTYNVDSFIKSQTGTLLGVSNITSVHVTSCVLTINNPDAKDNLQNFQSGYAQFSSTANTSPFQINIPTIDTSYATTISIPVDTTIELKSYIGNTVETFNYSLTGTIRKATTIPLNCTLQFTFSVAVQG